MPIFEGDFVNRDFRFAIAISRFNTPIMEQLLEGALDGFRRHGVKEDDITVVWVPGAFEIPLIARELAASQKFDAVVCLGAVIRGETPHFDYVAGQSASGILSASLETKVPIIYSIITTNTVEQAEQRAGVKGGNKGFEGALAALEMANLRKQLSSEPQPLHPPKQAVPSNVKNKQFDSFKLNSAS